MSLTTETETISFNSGGVDCSGSLVGLSAKRTAGIVRNSPSRGLRLSPANTSTLALLANTSSLALLRRSRPPIA